MEARIAHARSGLSDEVCAGTGSFGDGLAEVVTLVGSSDEA